MQTCEQWLEWVAESTQQQEQAIKKELPTSAAPTPGKAQPGKLSYMEQREYDQMEERILTAEAELAALQERMADPALAADAASLEECWQRQQELSTTVDRLYQRWGELEERKNR